MVVSCRDAYATGSGYRKKQRIDSPSRKSWVAGKWLGSRRDEVLVFVNTILI
jgi:hypothetical protein